jgi:RNA polymerase sigma factor (sigma-70 family)
MRIGELGSLERWSGSCYDATDDYPSPGRRLPMTDDNTAQLQRWLNMLQGGDDDAREALIRHSCERLRRLTRKMLRWYPRLQRWEQTDDVLQSVLLRLHRSLSEIKPKSVPEFLGLAATQIRRSLIDLARHHFGPRGDVARYETDNSQCERGSLVKQARDRNTEPQSLQEWSDFHEQIGALPNVEREIFNLLFYEGFAQAEAAKVLNIDVRTVKRRWRSARLMICEAMGGQPPE